MSPAYLEVLKMNMYLMTACMKGENVGGMLVYERVPLKLPPLVNELHTAYGPIVSEAVDDVVKREVLEALLKSTANIAN